MKKLLFVFIGFIWIGSVWSQTLKESIFREVEIRIDTSVFSFSKNAVSDDEGNEALAFIYENEDEVAEVSLIPNGPFSPEQIILLPSGDFDILDSLYRVDDQYKFKVRFRDLTNSGFLKFIFHLQKSHDVQVIGEIPLLPCTQTRASLLTIDNELFIGEEKVFDVVVSNPDNIRFSGEWTEGDKIDYRLEKQDNRLKLFVIPNELGSHTVSLPLKVKKPLYDAALNKVSYQLSPLEHTFFVKTSRLKFLSVDKREITLDDDTRSEGVEFILDNTPLLQMNKTYRLENNEEPGGTLIAEIITRSPMANNRVLCLLRAYNYHRTADGYLYIKDGDEPRFITNFSITPKTSISAISVLREGNDWVKNVTLHPGEIVEIKIEGEALHKADFYFEDLLDITGDTLVRGETEFIYKLKVPVDIAKKRLNLYNHSSPTGFYFNVREYAEPRAFDYIYVNYGDINRMVSNIRGPVLYNKGIRDVIISFNGDRIDSDTKLYGRQHLQIDFRITGPKNELIDMRTLENIIVCPSAKSPRYAFYDKDKCTNDEISLNKYIRRNTNDLEDWSRIEITIRHDPDKYDGEGQQKRLEIVLKKNYKLDIDVSFPAGLITVSQDSENGDNLAYSNLYGISMAMVAQFSFYHPDKIAKLRPYRVGAGFLALDAFNFQSDKQDLAFVLLGSIYPSSRDRKLSFPLYVGCGFQFRAQKWMLLIGPGISIKL
ncbi:MAG: hypothetical protein JXK95_15575 [Bacteroidales bacterium]|nr:hypothetical protein [Bacteroidales bacterium]